MFALKALSLKWKITYGRKGMTADRVTDRKKSLAAWLRKGLIRLGPTFIKIGQQFSTRVDVLSKEFVFELEKVCVPSVCQSCTWYVTQYTAGREA